MTVKDLKKFLDDCYEDHEIFLIPEGGDLLHDGEELNDVIEITSLNNTESNAVILLTTKKTEQPAD